MIINLYRAPVDIKLRNINNSNTPFYCQVGLKRDGRERERECLYLRLSASSKEGWLEQWLEARADKFS